MSLMRRSERLPLAWPEWFGRFPVPQDLFEGLDVTEPAMRLEEKVEGDTLVVRAEMPGIDPDTDVEITVEDASLHIRAERHEQTRSEDKGRYRSEFRYGAFSRTVPMPAGAKESDVAASYKDGILEVRVPIDTAKAEATRVPVNRA